MYSISESLNCCAEWQVRPDRPLVVKVLCEVITAATQPHQTMS
jgi:hypothetical protein